MSASYSQFQCCSSFKKKKFIQLIYKICPNTGSYKNASVYQRQDIETSPSTKKSETPKKKHFDMI